MIALIFAAQLTSVISLENYGAFTAGAALHAETNGTRSGTNTTRGADSLGGLVDTAGSPTWIYRDWLLQFPAATSQRTIPIVDGLGSVDFILALELDAWDWSMPGPVATTLTQPTLGQFVTEGFQPDDAVFGSLSGSWTLTGPVSSVSDTFSIQPSPAPGQYWERVSLDPAPSLINDAITFDLPDDPLWTGELDGHQWTIRLGQLITAGSVTVPEPPQLAAMILLIMFGFAVDVLVKTVLHKGKRHKKES